MNFMKGDSELFGLISKVRAFEKSGTKDISKIAKVLEYVLTVWMNRKDDRKRKVKFANKYNEKICAQYEIENEIIVNMIYLLNKKISRVVSIRK